MSSEITDVSSPLRVVETPGIRGDSPRNVSSAIAATTPPAVESAAPASTPDQLQVAVATLNQHFMMARSDIKFSVVPDLGMLVVAVVDAHDGTVLMQIPTEQALRTAREVKRGQDGLNLIKAVA